MIIESSNINHVMVARAASKDETRYFMMGIHVEGGKMIATDGRRLHWADCPYDDGEYQIVKSTKYRMSMVLNEQFDGQYPNWERVIPDGCDNPMEVNLTKDKESYGIATIIRLLPDEVMFQLDYLKDIYGFVWNVSVCGEKNNILRFDDEEDTRHAVIACMDNR